MPGTAAGMYNISEREASRRLKNPQFALDAGFRYLSHQKKTFGTWRLALAAYNAGPNAVREYGGVPPYAETQNYVRSILSKAGVTRSPTAAADRAEPAAPSSGAPAKVGPPNLSGLAVSNLQELGAGSYNPQKALGNLAMTVSSSPVETPVSPPKALPDTGTRFDLPEDGKWEKWVKVPDPAGGPSPPHKPVVLRAVANLARRYGSPLQVWDNTTHSVMTVNNNRSAHADGMAADIPAKGKKLKKLGYLALVMAGMPPEEARKARRTGGLFNVGRYQVIFATNEGGNHHDHVHIGIRR